MAASSAPSLKMVAIWALVLCVVMRAQLASVHARAMPEKEKEKEKEKEVLLQMPLAKELADVLHKLIPNGGVEDCTTEECKSCYHTCRIWCRFDKSCYPGCAEMFGCDSL